MNTIREELIEKYRYTGRVGFNSPQTMNEAMELIDTIVKLYNESEEVVEPEILNLCDITEKLRNYFNED